MSASGTKRTSRKAKSDDQPQVDLFQEAKAAADARYKELEQKFEAGINHLLVCLYKLNGEVPEPELNYGILERIVQHAIAMKKIQVANDKFVDLLLDVAKKVDVIVAHILNSRLAALPAAILKAEVARIKIRELEKGNDQLALLQARCDFDAAEAEIMSNSWLIGIGDIAEILATGIDTFAESEGGYPEPQTSSGVLPTGESTENVAPTSVTATRFSYEAIDGNTGGNISSTISANSEAEARVVLQKAGLHAIRIKPASVSEDSEWLEALKTSVPGPRTFRYEAMDSAGTEIKDSIVATSEEDAAQKIKRMGYFVTKIIPAPLQRGTSSHRG